MTRTRVALVIAIPVLVVLLAIFLGLAPGARAADDPEPTASVEPWPCRQAGWEVGDQWGPGPLDIVPDVPICEDEPEPVASDEPLTVDVQSEVYVGPETTPPPTDTK